MSSDKKIKKDKEIFLELEAQIKEIKHQLNEQLRCLDQRLESQVCMVWELQEFYQRRSEVELEYAKNIEKLVKQTMARHKAEKQKREQWQVYSSYKMWQTVLGITLKQSKNRSTLGEAFSSAISAKFTQLMEDMQRVYKKCREMAVVMHDELTKAVTELHSSMKTYHIYHSESQQAELKFEKAEKEKNRIEQDSKKGVQSKRFKAFEKQFEKHKVKFEESDLKALKARNDYLLCLDSANGAIRKFFVDDLPELINVMDYSYHISLGQVMMCIVDMEETVNRIHLESLTLLSHKARDLNQSSDRQAFLQQFHQIFSLPKKFEFQPHRGDRVCEVSATALVREELAERFKTIVDRLHNLKLENDEIWKTLETTDNALLEKKALRDLDVIALFRTDKDHATPQTQQTAPSKSVTDTDRQNKTERIETEEFYLSKFKNYQLNSNLIARLQAKCATIEKVLGRVSATPESQSHSPPKRPLSLAFRQTKKRHLGKSSLVSQPKLFGGSIEEYVQVTGQEIPSLVRNCIRIINLFGMHHQGVFRVSGSQHEINDFKNLFERGEEPVLSNVDSRDINSIAGVLKLYFRELREPLFPLQLFDELIACPSKYNVSDMIDLKKCIGRIQELLLPLPRSTLVVMRYLFAFLNHLSEYSDENMMDAHNLAVCFGPTLLPIQPDHDQMRCQNYVNELIRILIVHQEAIFPKDGGPVYEKCIVEDDGEDSLDSLLEDAVGDGSEEDLEPLEAVAVYDFTSRNTRELSFRKGDVLILHTHLSPDWWEGTFNNQTGLIPQKYIAIQGRASSDKDNIDIEEKMKMSTESLPAKPYGLVTSSSSRPPTVEPLDRSISQPNISAGPPPISPSTFASFTSTSSDLSRGGYGSCSESLQSFLSKDDAETGSTHPLGGCSGGAVVDGPGGEQLTSIGSDIVSGSSLIEMEPTPVLVLNLPFTITPAAAAADSAEQSAVTTDVDRETDIISPDASLSSSLIEGCNPVPSTFLPKGQASSPAMTNADLFAIVGQGTIKKGSGRHSVGLSCPSSSTAKVEPENLKQGASPDIVGTDEMFSSTFDEIEQTLSGFVVSTSLKLFGINPLVSSPSSNTSLHALFPSAASAKDDLAPGSSTAPSSEAALLPSQVPTTSAESNTRAENPAGDAEPPLKPSDGLASSGSGVIAHAAAAAAPALALTTSSSSASLTEGGNCQVKPLKPPVDPKPKPPPTLRKPVASIKEKPNVSADGANK